MNNKASSQIHSEAMSGERGDIRGFFISRLSILMALDFLLRLRLAPSLTVTDGVVTEALLGMLNELALIAPYILITGTLFYFFKRSRRLAWLLISFLDMLYVTANFSSHNYFVFFSHFPNLMELSRLGTTQIWMTILMYVLPKFSTLLILFLPFGLLVTSTFISMRKNANNLAVKKLAFWGAMFLVCGFLPSFVLNLSLINGPEYYYLHPLVSRSVTIESSRASDPVNFSPEVIARLRKQVDCNGRFVDPEYPMLKDSPRNAGNSRLIKNGMPNIVMVVIESFASQNIGVLGSAYKITPNFDRLAGEGILFTNLRSFSRSTTVAEINMLCSQWIGGKIPEAFLDNKILGFPHVLKNNGYSDAIWIHNGEKGFENQDALLKHMGFDKLYGLKDMPADCIRGPWGCSDKSLMKFAVDRMSRLKEPFFTYVLTISNHPPFTPFPDDGNRIDIKGSTLTPERKKSLEMMHYSDEALGLLMDLSSGKEFFANTIFVITADHDIRENELMPPINKETDVFDITKIPLLIWSPLITEPKTIATDGSSTDIITTLLSILGISSRDSFVGADLMDNSSACERMRVGRPLITRGGYAMINSPRLPIYRLSDYSKLSGEEREAVFREMIKDFRVRWDYYPAIINEGKLYPK